MSIDHILCLFYQLVANPCYARNAWGCQFPPSHDQQRRLPFQAKVKVDCWSSPWRLSILPPLPPPKINRGDHLFMQKWKLTVDPLHDDCQSCPPPTPTPKDQQRWSSFHAKVKVDCWPSPWQLLIPPSTVNRGNPPFHAKVKVDCWPSPWQSSIPPPQSTEAIAFSCKSEIWQLILSMMIVDWPPYTFRLSNLSFVCNQSSWFPHLLENEKTFSSQGKVGEFWTDLKVRQLYPKYWKNKGIFTQNTGKWGHFSQFIF